MCGGIIHSMVDVYKQTADVCLEHLSREGILRAADWIEKARCLYLCAEGDTYLSLLGFANQMAKLGKL